MALIPVVLRNAANLFGSCTWKVFSGFSHSCAWFQSPFNVSAGNVRSPSHIRQASFSNITMSSSGLQLNEASPTGIHSAIELLKELTVLKNASGLSVESKIFAFCNSYKTLSLEGKTEVVNFLSQLHTVQSGSSFKAAHSYLDAKDKDKAVLTKAEEKLRESLGADLQWILACIGRAEGGIRFLVNLRADVLELASQNAMASEVTELKSLGNAIRNFILPCFTSDLLQLERVTWSSPGELLQKVSEGEAVHPIRSWADLKRRLGPYRRCFILSHPALPLQPVAVLHVALTNQIPASIHQFVPRSNSALIDEDQDPVSSQVGVNEGLSNIDTAVFYSISSTQKGLAGIDLGQCLIKRAVARLQAELPNIHHFTTLSPIPGFRAWLLQRIREAERGQKEIFASHEVQQLSCSLSVDRSDVPGEFKKLIASHSWVKDENMSDLLKIILMRLCGSYLYSEKRRNYALDSVANFHLRNGAVMWRLNWKADLSPRGLNNSCGMMVNYRYYLEACEENSRQYVENCHLEASKQIRNLASVKPCRTSHL